VTGMISEKSENVTRFGTHAEAKGALIALTGPTAKYAVMVGGGNGSC